jgi:hypothetical protein
MGNMAASLGIGSSPGAQGYNFRPTAAPLINPVTQAQADTAYSQTQQGIANQADFLTALQAQNGIGNQSQVYNQLQNVASGQGPNPAQAMLAQATGANTANQAALMAGQRGAGANTGLIARQAAQQGGANQMASAGQAASMQAQQSLGALGQLGGIAGQQVGQQAAATGAYTGATQSEQANLLNSIAQQNVANVNMQSSLNQQDVSQGQAAAKSGLLGGLGLGGLAKGGVVRKNMADGGPAAPAAPTMPKSYSFTDFLTAKQGTASGQGGYKPVSGYAKQQASNFVQGLLSPSKDSSTNGITATGQAAPTGDNSGNLASSTAPEGAASGIEGLAKGGKIPAKVPAMVSPGEVYIPPHQIEKVKKGKDPIKSGEKIPGKAKVKGDSLKNDTVPKTLEEGGIVLPKSVMESKHPHWEAHKFVSNILKKGLHSKKK